MARVEHVDGHSGRFERASEQFPIRRIVRAEEATDAEGDLERAGLQLVLIGPKLILNAWKSMN